MHATIETDSASDTIGKAGDDDDIIIRVEKLGKRYQLGRQTAGRSQYRTLRDVLAEGTQRLFRRREKSADTDEFWALKDVSFEIGRGEVVGIIGRNGAGKSTLLKILSRITEPTTGTIRIRGRVASLLEVGTGFHPELTGRENLFLNGAILGMSRAEIKAKFDEIVAFAEVEKFLDTPVKRYSSGMYVRLAFAVAAHLEPEILVVDEVLAVGDAEFQKKCLGKMHDVSRAGRTVLFVSHNMGAIRSLCRSALLLNHGELVHVGTISEAIAMYFRIAASTPSQWRRSAALPSAPGVYLESINIFVQGGETADSVSTAESFEVEVNVSANESFNDAEIAIRFTNQDGIPVFTTANADRFNNYPVIEQGKHTFRVRIPGEFLTAGTYYLLVAALIPERVLFDCVENEVSLKVDATGSQAHAMKDHRLGVVNPVLDWSHEVRRDFDRK